MAGQLSGRLATSEDDGQADLPRISLRALNRRTNLRRTGCAVSKIYDTWQAAFAVRVCAHHADGSGRYRPVRTRSKQSALLLHTQCERTDLHALWRPRLRVARDVSE